MTDQSLTYAVDEGEPDGPLLVLLHGRGADERDLVSLGRMLHPTATTIAPRAPFPGAPWGYGGGYAWYRYLQDTTPETVSFREGQARLADFLAWIPGHLGRADAPLVVGGFSQGGTSTLAWTLGHPGAARAALIFSGFMPDHPDVTITPATVGRTPFWWSHGTLDSAIPYAFAEAGWQTLRDAGADLTTFTDAGTGHTITREALAGAAALLRDSLAS
ncbi:MAG TPA: hypothetical protein VFN22_06605 [Gemmatimonadales bacterium]|nr:hypothetical protein [Gemmatimonadales bacterium]